MRREYQAGHGVPCLIAVHQDATGKAINRAQGYAHGIGGARGGLITTSFAEETETDLFGEQAVLCGGVTELVVQGFETLCEAGYQPEVAYFECMHELKLIVDLLHEGGMAKMHRYISETAQYGDLTRGPRVIDAGTRERMREILAEIRDGQFAREWVAEYAPATRSYQALKAADLAHPIEQVGAKLRAQMPWLEATRPTPIRPAAAAARGGAGQARRAEVRRDRLRTRPWPTPPPTAPVPHRPRSAARRRWCARSKPRASKYVFGYPGGAIMPVYDALVGSSLRHILVRHEQGAALAADGYARASGKVGVCMATSGPGRDQPGHRHRQRLPRFGADGGDHRPGRARR